MVHFLQEYSFSLLNPRVCHENPKPHQFSYRVTASLQVKGLQRHNSLLRAMGGICLQTLSKHKLTHKTFQQIENLIFKLRPHVCKDTLVLFEGTYICKLSATKYGNI